MASFSDLKNTKVGSVERPKPLPAGHYRAVFSGIAKEKQNRAKDNFALSFPVKLVAPMDDVDQEALAEAGGIPEKREFTVDFWMSEGARWRFTEFGKAMGHSDDLTLSDLAEALATSGEPFIVEGQHQLNAEKPDEPPFFRIQNPVAEKDYTAG